VAISIDIGTRVIHIAMGQAKKSGHVSITRCNLVKVPADILAESPVQQQKSVFLLVKPALDAMHAKHVACSFTLPDDKFLIRELTLPKAPKADLRGMVKQEMISLYSAGEDDLVEMDIIAQLPDGMLNVRGAAFSKALADGYMQFAIDSAMTPQSLSYHSFNIGKLASFKPDINGAPISGRNVVLADMGMVACIVHVISDGKAVFSRYLPVGFSDLNYILTPRSVLDETDGRKGLLTASFDRNGAEYKEYSPYIAEQVETFFYRLSDEFSKLLRFLASSRTVAQIDAMYLFGGNSLIPGLAPRLGEAVSIRTEVVGAVSTITSPPELAPNLPFLLNCAGSLIQ